MDPFFYARQNQGALRRMSSYLDHNPVVGSTRQLRGNSGRGRSERSLGDYLSSRPEHVVLTGLIANVNANDSALPAFCPFRVFAVLFSFIGLFQC
jgi:hypothetical protein